MQRAWTLVLVVAACGGTKSGGTTSSASSSAQPDVEVDPPTPATRAVLDLGPDLPAPVPAAKAVAAVDGCGSVVIDGENVPLECGSDAELASVTKDAAEEVVARAQLQPSKDLGSAALPKLVDHRRDGTEGTVRSQGRSSACTAFSLAAAVDHAVMLHLKGGDPVSSLHIWSRYHQGNSALAIDTNLGLPIARESDWPFDAKLACSWEPASKKKKNECGAHVSKGQPVDAALVAGADAKAYARIQHVTRLDHPSTAVLQQVLAKGQDVWLGMHIGNAFDKVTAANPVIAEFDPTKVTGGHRFLLAGYRTQANGTYFLVHNSWGTKWGDGGYAWLHASALNALDVPAVIVDAVPVSAKHPLAPPSVPKTKCAKKGELPDSSTGACSKPCPDGGARFDKVCPNAKGCLAGEINVSGACVVAAPNVRGIAPKNNVEFDCHAGGCVYTIPKGQLGCTETSCAHACPAPRYVLVHGSKGLYCSE